MTDCTGQAHTIAAVSRPLADEINQLVELYNQSRYEEAENLAEKLTARYPLDGFGWKALGSALKEQGRCPEALVPSQLAVGLLPGDSEAHYNLANTCRELGLLAEAENSYTRALEINPEYAGAYYNLGNLLLGIGRLTEAEACYRKALQIQPGHVEAHNNLGNALKDQGRLCEAESSYRSACELRPEYADAYSNLLFCRTHNAAVDAATLFEEHCRFGERFEKNPGADVRQHSNPIDPERSLRIGFVSGDFCNHPVAQFFGPVLSHLTGHEKLSLHAYSNRSIQDAVTKRLHGYFAGWNDIAGLSEADLDQKIRDDRIDILIDLSGHTAYNQLLTFAAKPAPLQASWMGYPGTTGLKAMDYYLADRFFLPLREFEAQFTEKIVFLPASAPFTPVEDAPAVNDLPALSNGHITFGSFNRLTKLSHSVIAIWARLLRALPDSRVVLGALPQDGYGSLIDWFAEEGITRERLDLHPRCGLEDYLALHRQVDICLDTFPYNGGTTTCHALWMGVPTLTIAGGTPASRQGAAFLSHVGLEGFIAHNAEEFVSVGVHWAHNIETLARIRGVLREAFRRSPLRRPELIAGGLERALRIMWQRWCNGLPPAAIDVSDKNP